MNVPFRIGTTSFIYPGGWLANIERLAGRFSDIEVLFFDVDGPGALPCLAEREGIAAWKARAGLTYSLHTPLGASLASADEQRRNASVASVQRAIKAADAFRPDAYVVHVYLGEHEHDQDVPSDLAAWRRRAARSLEEILRIGIDPSDLCVELLDYDFALIEPVIADLGLSVTLDVGHLLRDALDEEKLLRKHLDRTRLIQWHGVDASGRDHRSLAHYPYDRARRLWNTLLEYPYQGVLTLEVFREADLEESMAVVTALLAEGHA
jgi:sugar phosphate isomerase/epimerase